MPRILIQPDTLDAETQKFAPGPIARPLFMTSLQKSGTHLLRNVLRMFVPIEQQYRRGYIQAQNLRQHGAAFSLEKPQFSVGHLAFSPAAAVQLKDVPKLLLYRDPYDWVLARARFFSSDQFEDEMPFLKQGTMAADDLLSLMIVGLPKKFPSLARAYETLILPWLTSGSVYSVRYEDLKSHCGDCGGKNAEDYFAGLFRAAGIERPDDWRERIAAGADSTRSGTARQNLSGADANLPAELPSQHRRLVDYSAPGLRAYLGYAN